MRLGGPILDDLCEQIGETVALAMLGNHGATIVRWVEAGGPITSLCVQAPYFLARSATGRAFVAYCRVPFMKKLLERELRDTAEESGQTVAAQIQDLEPIINEFGCTASPVRAAASHPESTVSVRRSSITPGIWLPRITSLGAIGHFNTEWNSPRSRHQGSRPRIVTAAQARRNQRNPQNSAGARVTYARQKHCLSDGWKSLGAIPLRTNSLMVTLFGDAIAPHGAALLGGLIELVAPLGVNDRAVRTSVFRLMREDWLFATPTGRRSEYSLTGGRTPAESPTPIDASMTRHRMRGMVNGNWSLFPDGTATESRETLRRELLWDGFGTIAQGVFGLPSADAGRMREIPGNNADAKVAHLSATRPDRNRQ